MAELRLMVNGTSRTVDVEPDTPLLWVLRDTVGLTGTKYGCGEGLCGSCTVLMDGEAVRSCVLPVSQAVGHKIVTIEGLSKDRSHPLQKAWIEDEVPQCGYCQSGQLMVGRFAAGEEAQANGRGHRRGHGGRFVQVRDLPENSARDSSRGRGGEPWPGSLRSTGAIS